MLDSVFVFFVWFFGRSVVVFSVLLEEIRMNESVVGVKEVDCYNSGVLLFNGCWFFDGCFSSVFNYNGYKKVSVVLL